MREISLIINNKPVKANPGTRILEAAIDAGIDIPHSCYVPNVEPPVQACKLCVVEVSGRIVQACSELVIEGMEVTTSNPELERMRRQRLHFPG